MAYVRNQFYDPRGGGRYFWQVNHSEEEEVGVERPANVIGRVGGGYIIQQGADGPLVLRLAGTIFHQAQFNAMRDFALLSKSQTVYFTDFTGGEFEVLITSFKPTRQRTARNPRDPSIPLHFWRYTIEMQVIHVTAGDWVGFA